MECRTEWPWRRTAVCVDFSTDESLETVAPSAPEPLHSEALGLARLVAGIGDGSLILAAHSEAQAARLIGAARALAPGLHPMLLPGWDCLPFDRTSPSRAVMGQRMDALAVMAAGGTRLLVASVQALAQNLPDPSRSETLTIKAGQPLCRAALLADLDRLGYAALDEADQPGDVAAQGSVIDLVPADGGHPVRIRLEDPGPDCTVAGLETYDATTQRSRGAMSRLTIGPASEVVTRHGGEEMRRSAGLEHRLPDLAGPLASVFTLMPHATLVLDGDADARMDEYLAQIEEARGNAGRPLPGIGWSGATGGPLSGQVRVADGQGGA